MSWNLFEKIINAIKPYTKSKQSSEVPDASQQWPENSSDTSQSWPESSTEQQPEASQEPSPSYQETSSSPQKTDWQQD